MGFKGKLPLIEALERQRKSVRFRFHVPAHLATPGRKCGCRYDLTELPGLDDLYNPGGVIEESQRLTAEFFGAEDTFFLVNGSSAGLMAALWASSRAGETVILGRNIHRSVVAGLIWSGARPRFIPVEDYFHGIPLNIRKETAASLLNEIEVPSVLVVTNPSYWGISADFRSLRNLVREPETVFIVDEAHGGHFGFNNSFPPAAKESGADVWVNSAHKTLGALTSGGLLHRQGKRVDVNRLRFALGSVQTSSPSYPVLASLELLRTRSGIEWDRALDTADFARCQIRNIKGFSCLDRSQLPDGYFLDPLRLTIFTESISLSGYQVGAVLKDKYGIEVEMTGPHYLVALIQAGHRKRDIKALIHALSQIGPIYDDKNPGKYIPGGYPVPPQELTPREAVEAEWEQVPLKESCGRVSAVIVAPFPPGIPVLIPGEIITREIMDRISEELCRGQYFQGLGHGPGYPLSVVG